MQMADALGISSEFSAGQPVARRKSDELDRKAYRLGFGAAKNFADRAALEKEKAEFAQEQAKLLQMIMLHQMQQNAQIAQAQQQGAYQGSYQATGDHLAGYSDQVAGVLGGEQGDPMQGGGMAAALGGGMM